MPDAYVAAGLRRAVFKRAQFRCEYCRTPDAFVPDPFEVEHIVPLSRKGKTRLNNLALSCPICNSRKYNKVKALDPLSQRLVPLFHPHKQRWLEHFAWSEDGLEVVGLTSTGRVTVEALQLNAPKMLNLRRLLTLADLHPPE